MTEAPKLQLTILTSKNIANKMYLMPKRFFVIQKIYALSKDK